MSNKDHTPDGLGEEDLVDATPLDFERGAGGEPLITDPLTGKRERFTRMSSQADVLDDKSGLNNWLVSKAMEGMAGNEVLRAKVLAVVPYEDHKSEFTKLREEAIQAGRGAYKADIGTAVHAMSERFEQEPDYDPGSPYTECLEAYEARRKVLGLESVHFEIQLVNREIRSAGTVDRIYRLTEPLMPPDGHVIPAGELIIGDIKTGSSLEYSLAGYSVQLAGYAGGELYDVATNTFQPTPTINQKWAIIMKIGVDDATCEFLWVNLEDGRVGAKLANDVREWRRTWRRKDGRKSTCVPVQLASDAPTPKAPVKKAAVKKAAAKKKVAAKKAAAAKKRAAKVEPSEPEAVPVVDLNDVVDEWRDWCSARLLQIRGNPEMMDWMLQRWPEGMAPPKRFQTVQDGDVLDTFLGKVEAQFGLPFVPRPSGLGAANKGGVE